MEVYRVKCIERREVFKWILDDISFYIPLDKAEKNLNASGVYYLSVDYRGFNSSVIALLT